MDRGLNRKAIAFAALMVAGCNEAPVEDQQAIPQPKLSAKDDVRLTALSKKYQDIRKQLRSPEIPKNYLTLQQQKYVIEQEMKRLEPLALALAQQREDGLDRRSRTSEVTRQADLILNDAH